MILGTTFDPQYCKSLNLDPLDTLEKLIELELNPIRIGVKWSEVEKRKDEYTWREYYEIFEILQNNKIEIIPVIGIKVPRWPEVYIPDYLEFDKKDNYTISARDEFLKKRLFKFLKELISHYQKLKNVKCVQIENEPLIRFGPKNWKLSYEFLEEEVELVRKLWKKPILLTTSGLPTTGLPVEIINGGLKAKLNIGKLADCIGLNVFPRFEIKKLGKVTYANASNTSWQYLNYWFNRYTKLGKECIVTELQAEPWQSKDWNYGDPKGNPSCTTEMVKSYIKKLREIGFKKSLVWGTEFHVACKEKGNEEWVNVIHDT
jgi:hypothetical protein